MLRRSATPALICSSARLLRRSACPALDHALDWLLAIQALGHRAARPSITLSRQRSAYPLGSWRSPLFGSQHLGTQQLSSARSALGRPGTRLTSAQHSRSDTRLLLRSAAPLRYPGHWPLPSLWPSSRLTLGLSSARPLWCCFSASQSIRRSGARPVDCSGAPALGLSSVWFIRGSTAPALGQSTVLAL